MKAPTISVIIPIHGGVHLLGPLLERLAAQTLPPSEIIVVDNSTETPRNIPKEIRYFKNGGIRTISGNYNLGAQHATGELLLLTQQDCYPESLNAIEQLVRTLSDGIVAATAEITLPEDVFCTYNFWGQVMMAKWTGTARQGISGKLDLIRRDVFHRIGGYDTVNFAFAGEDIDLCVRLLDQGELVVANTRVIHHHNQHVKTNWVDVVKRNYMYAEGFGALLRKHRLKLARVPYSKHWTHHLNKFGYPALLALPFFPIASALIIVLVSNLAQAPAWKIRSPKTAILLGLSPVLFFTGLLGTLKGFFTARQSFRC
jgi:GT2 family glycosyltransferase